jgi:hypothetical protein
LPIINRQQPDMKQVENKSPVNSAKKAAKINITLSIVNALKTAVAKLGKGSDKLEDEIEKGSKKLAKKIIKELKFHDATPASGNKDNKIAKAPEKPAAEVKKDVQVPAKPKAAAQKKKETQPATVAKPVAVKSVAAKPIVAKPTAVKKEKTATKK